MHLEGLLAAAAMHEIVHLGLDFVALAAAQGQFDFDDEFLRLLESALAIRKTEVRRFIGTDAALAVYDAYPRHNMAHFAVVSAGVHEYGPTEGSRNAAGKFHPCQAVFLSELADVL